MPFIWIKDGWIVFEKWIATYAPGWKTQIVNGLGMLGSGAAIAQEYIAQVPLDKFITAQSIVIVSLVLFTLSFWFRRLANYEG